MASPRTPASPPPQRIHARAHFVCVAVIDQHGRPTYCTPDDAERLAAELLVAAKAIRAKQPRRPACTG